MLHWRGELCELCERVLQPYELRELLCSVCELCASGVTFYGCCIPPSSAAQQR